MFRFPFDKQTCVLSFFVGGTLSYVNLEMPRVEFDLFCPENDEWRITDFTSKIKIVFVVSVHEISAKINAHNFNT